MSVGVLTLMSILTSMPAEYTWTVSPTVLLISPAGICDLPPFLTQTTSTDGLLVASIIETPVSLRNDPAVDPRASTFTVEEPGGAQDLQVMGDGRLGQFRSRPTDRRRTPRYRHVSASRSR